MNETEHTFPLPETELRALTQVEEQLRHQPFHRKAGDFVRAHRWQVLAAVFVTAALMEILRKRRHRQTLPA